MRVDTVSSSACQCTTADFGALLFLTVLITCHDHVITVALQGSYRPNPNRVFASGTVWALNTSKRLTQTNKVPTCHWGPQHSCRVVRWQRLRIFVCAKIDLAYFYSFSAFSALILLVVHQEGHPACRNILVQQSPKIFVMVLGYLV